MPPGTLLVSFFGAEGVGVGELGAMGVVEAVVDGKKGSEKGWVAPGVEEEIAAGAGPLAAGVVDEGGVDGAAFLVAGTVATVRWEMRDGCEVVVEMD